MAAGKIIDSSPTSGFTWFEVFLMSSLLLAMAFVAGIYRVDGTKYGGYLNASAEKRRMMDETGTGTENLQCCETLQVE